MTPKEYIVYKERWLILTGMLACGFIRGYLPAMFAISNDMMTSYFQITSLQADMLSAVDGAVAFLVCLVTSVIGKKVGVRVLSLTMATSFFMCLLMVGIAITSRGLYVLMLLGRLVSGISVGIVYIFPPILANAWFPSDQIATAASIPILSIAIGGVIAPVVFSNLLPKASGIVTMANATSNSLVEIEEFDLLQSVFLANMAVFLALSVLSIVIFCVFAKDHPPTPPSGAQAELLETERNRKHEKQNRRSLLQILKLLGFWNIVAVTVVNSASMPFSLYLQPSMLKATFESASNSVAGYCLILSAVTSGCGSIAAGKILDRWRGYKKFCILGLLLGGGASIAVYFSHVYHIISIFFIFHAFVGFFRLFIYVCTVELLLEVTYPLDGTEATCLFFTFYNLSTFLWTPLERWVMMRFGEQYVAWVVVFSQIMAALILLLLNPLYKRMQANRSKVEDCSQIEMDSKLIT